VIGESTLAGRVLAEAQRDRLRRAASKKEDVKLLVAAMTWAFVTSPLSGVRPHKCVTSKKAHKKRTKS
jgi:hypothetical protein